MFEKKKIKTNRDLVFHQITKRVTLILIEIPALKPFRPKEPQVANVSVRDTISRSITP